MKLVSALILGILVATPARSANIIEYHMRMAPSADDAKRIAITFDACTGKVDERILNALVDNKIKATIFVTARWLKRNPKAIETLKANSDLIEIENHGAKHLTAVDVRRDVFGLRSAGSPKAVATEVEDGAAAVKAAIGNQPTWYRGAAAIYTVSTMEQVKSLGFKLGGFSFSGDGGATWTAGHTEKAISAAKDGDVIIAHINQPARPAGEGVVKGILKLKEQGFTFVTLQQGFPD